MPAAARRPGRGRRTVAAILVAVVQVVFALAPLSETPEYRTGAHVEQAGVERHHSHDGVCFSCTAIRLAANAEAASVGSQPDETARAALPRTDRIVLRSHASFSQRSRAPPVG